MLISRHAYRRVMDVAKMQKLRKVNDVSATNGAFNPFGLKLSNITKQATITMQLPIQIQMWRNGDNHVEIHG